MYLSNGLGAAVLRRNPAGRIIPVPAIRRRRGFGYFPGDPVLYYDPATGRIVSASTPGALPVPAQGATGYNAAAYGSPLDTAEKSTYVNAWIAGAPAGSNPSYPGQAPGQGPPTLIYMPPDQMAVAMAAGYKVGGPGNPPPSSSTPGPTGYPVMVTPPVVYTPPQPAPPAPGSPVSLTLNSPLPAPAPVASYPSATVSAAPAPGPVAVNVSNTGNPVGDFLGGSLQLGTFQFPLWLAGVVVVGGVVLLMKGGK
jgi:hypothetical protein